jgi:iron complex transport system substrate-binding protein
MNVPHHARSLTAALAAVVALVTACSSSGSAASSRSTPAPQSTPAAFPVTVAAANGPVTLAHRPSAIVSLSPTATEMLFAIGAGSQVKAVDENSDYPASAPHTKLDAFQLNTEAVAAYRPDLVVASNITAAQTKQLAALHIPVLDEPAAANLDQAYQEFVQLGQATGHLPSANAQVTKMKRQIASIVATTPKRAASYYYELDQTYYSVTSSTFVGGVLRLLGLRSIADAAKGAAASGGYPQLSGEFVLKANPAYIFLADTRCCRQSAATVAKRPGWSTMPAVRDGRIVALDDDIASRWGPRIVDLLRTVSQALRQHPPT